mmetsp:Transcript_23432/g.66858  ORF Transcript_23432/g.66858 Transcript_23432/m.66858 type:complete len:473 (-) Transcript_23432:144-1562(-)
MLRLPSAAMARRRVPTQTTLSEVCCCETESTADGSIAGASSSSSSRASSRKPVAGLAAYDFDERALGVGGSATVRVARPKAGGPRCALKALRKEGRSAQKLVQNETTMMQLLEHPGVCKLLDTFEDDDNFYLALEFVDGHELFEEVAAQTPMGERRAAEVMRQLLAALRHCHSRGVIHRDLKPENIMVAGRQGCGEPKVKLLDFGLAMREGQQLSGVSGTRPYLAPEAMTGRGACSAAMDLWSAGVILYTCLLGELPPSSVRSGAVPVLDAKAWCRVQVSAAAKDLVALLMRREPSERLTAAEAVQHPWLQGGASALPATKPRTQAAAAPWACAELLGKQRLLGLKRQSAAEQANKEVPREQLLGWAAAAAPAEHADALLGCVEAAFDVLDACGTGHVVVGEWLAWLDAATAEAGKEAGSANAFGFGLFGGCCAAQAAEDGEVAVSTAASKAHKQLSSCLVVTEGSLDDFSI